MRVRAKFALTAALGVALAGGYAWRLARHAEHRAVETTDAGADRAAAAAPGAHAALQHPIEQAAIASAASTDDELSIARSDGSDGSVRAALDGFASSAALDAVLVPDYLIQRVVATVDALSKRQVPSNIMPLRSASGVMQTFMEDGALHIDPRNAERYRPHIAALESLDVAQAARWYARNYALFQQAWRELGHASGYFNDQLIATIDLMLATPDPTSAPVLLRPNVLFVFADPELEALAAGQKLMLRVDPAQRALIGAKLIALRAALVAAPPRIDEAATGAEG